MSTSTRNSNRKAPKQAPIGGWEVVWFEEGVERRKSFDGPGRRVYKEADDFRKARDDDARSARAKSDQYPYLTALKK